MKSWLVKHREAIQSGLPVLIVAAYLCGMYIVIAKPAGVTAPSPVWLSSLFVVFTLTHSALLLYFNRIRYINEEVQFFCTQIERAKLEIGLLETQISDIKQQKP